VWQRLRLAVLDRDRWQCQMRGPHCTHHATHVDHVIPLVDGGGDDPANLRAACRTCNTEAGGGLARRYRTTVARYHTRF
jgi:5-methylcytosine-specific restriction protein A